MIKLMIVDDDALVRYGLISMVDWQINGYELVGEAENGLKALELYQKTKPDIMLCDIKMPKMDGLELIKKIREEDKNTKIVVLSYYSDLDIVKTALLSGADDYVLKTSVDGAELLRLLQKHISNIPQTSNEKEHHGYEKGYIIRTLIGAIKPSSPDMKQSITELTNLAEKNLYAIILSIDHFNELTTNYRLDDKQMLCRTILSIINDTLKSCTAYETDYLKENCFIVILNMPDRKSEFHIKHDLTSILGIIQANTKKFTNFTMSIGVSRQHSTFKTLNEAFAQANDALAHTFYFRTENIIFYSDIVSPKPLNIEDLERINNEVLDYLNTGDFKGLKKHMNTLKEEFINSRYKVKDIKYYAQNLQHLLINELMKKEMNIDISSMYYETLDNITNINNLFKIMQERLDTFESSYLQANKYSFSLNKAIKYLEMNYQNALLLQKDVSQYLKISNTYLSLLFKKELAVSFTDYLTSLRIEKACHLLKKTTKKIQDISDEVGFSTASYFVKTFKKYKKVTPREFRQKD